MHRGIRIRWGVSEKRWARDHHDHALQEVTFRLPLQPLIPKPQRPARIAAEYRNEEAAKRTNELFEQHLGWHQGIIQRLYEAESPRRR